MTPKEKATELIKKMLGKSPNVQDGITRTEYIILKGCALIAVDEMIKLAESYEDALGPAQRSDYDEFLKEVKQEIINL